MSSDSHNWAKLIGDALNQSHFGHTVPLLGKSSSLFYHVQCQFQMELGQCQAKCTSGGMIEYDDTYRGYFSWFCLQVKYN